MAKYIFVALIAAFALLLAGCTDTSSQQIKQGQAPGGTYWRGSANPILTVYEYSDFECPACKAAEPSIKTFLSRYQGKGVRLVYRHFPLETQHPQARLAAIASECAASEGKFWDYHDLLFEKSPALSRADLITYAAQLNLSANFEACLGTQPPASRVDAATAEGMTLGLTATPSFEMNGLILSGAQTPERLGQAADSMLSKVGVQQ